ncbi:hypothetical protein HJC23_005344 [Cyclotella cryptica]|uniref:phytol kinase n=1 Tax=Cyclotella cryptica TaxID=29204 RepID=A0ABD3PES0_9STRA|eukprot:CCRYP_015346-RA/>CCRYP_015346-RA protein AED:0.17 eAED:0.17 QI:0/-1/0/1/-1/1/1/0/412
MKSRGPPYRQARNMLQLLVVAAAVNRGVPATDAFTPQPQRTDAHLHTTQRKITTPIPNDQPRHSRSPTNTLWMIENGGSQEPSKPQPVNNSKYLLPTAALVSITLVTIAALTQTLPGPPIDATAPPPLLSTLPYGVAFSGSCHPYSAPLLLRDVSATVFSIMAATAFVKSITYPTQRGGLDPRDARKLIHTLSAPLFLCVWPLFSHAYGARVFAAIVPLLNALRLFVAGTTGTGTGAESTQKNLDMTNPSPSSVVTAGTETELARAISRSGDAKEALQGPFVYVMVLLVSTLFLWHDTPIGIVAVATMAVGDGLADLMGRRFGASNKWSFNKDKSVAGSVAFVIGSVLGSFGLISWLVWTGAMDPLSLDSWDLLARLLVIAVVCAGVELVPVVDDNYSVPISAGVLAAYLLN